MKQFDFDEWATLHEQDPEAFEVKRGATLERLIRSVDEESRHALEQTLFRVEMVRRRAKSPLQATIEASNLMWESFGKLREKIQELEASANLGPLPSRNGNRLRLVQDGDAETVDGASFDLIAPLDELVSGPMDAAQPSGKSKKVEAKIISFPRKG